MVAWGVRNRFRRGGDPTVPGRFAGKAPCFLKRRKSPSTFRPGVARMGLASISLSSTPRLRSCPRGTEARAHARALAAEMHSGVAPLRRECPTNFCRKTKPVSLSEAVSADLSRIDAAWGEARARLGQSRTFLFGPFSAANAMFAPVVNRVETYFLPVSPEAREFVAAMKIQLPGTTGIQAPNQGADANAIGVRVRKPLVQAALAQRFVLEVCKEASARRRVIAVRSFGCR